MIAYLYHLVAEMLLILFSLAYGGTSHAILRQLAGSVSIAALSSSVVLLALVQFSLLRFLRAVTDGAGRATLFALVAPALLLLYWSALLLSGVYYSRFGTFPGLSVLRDLWTTPGAGLLYLLTGVAPFELGLGLAVGLILLLASARVTSLHRMSPVRSLDWVALPLSLVLIVATAEVATSFLGELRFSLVLQKASLATNLINRMVTLSSENSYSLLAEALPRYPGEIFDKRVVKPRHVLLVIAEAVQARHHPAYGYERPTFPRMTARGGEWLALPHPVAHGNMTSSSFAVLFHNRYMAGVEGGASGARSLWRQFREAGVSTAFLSAGTLEWSYMAEGLALDAVDHVVSAKDLRGQQPAYLSDLASDYAVADDLILAEYGRVLREFDGGPSFAVLHLVASHFPFLFPHAGKPFTPQLEEVDLIQSSEGSPLSPLYRRLFDAGKFKPLAGGNPEYIERLVNSYDNGLFQIDSSIERLLGILKDAGMLESTVVIVTSDHGEAMGEHQEFFHGSSLREEQIHVPLLVRVGSDLVDSVKVRRVDPSSSTGLIDIIPSTLDLFGIPKPSWAEGTSWFSSREKACEVAIQTFGGTRVAVFAEGKKFELDIETRSLVEYDLDLDPGERAPGVISGVTNLREFAGWITHLGCDRP